MDKRCLCRTPRITDFTCSWCTATVPFVGMLSVSKNGSVHRFHPASGYGGKQKRLSLRCPWVVTDVLAGLCGGVATDAIGDVTRRTASVTQEANCCLPAGQDRNFDPRKTDCFKNMNAFRQCSRRRKAFRTTGATGAKVKPLWRTCNGCYRSKYCHRAGRVRVRLHTIRCEDPLCCWMPVFAFNMNFTKSVSFMYAASTSYENWRSNIVSFA